MGGRGGGQVNSYKSESCTVHCAVHTTPDSNKTSKRFPKNWKGSISENILPKWFLVNWTLIASESVRSYTSRWWQEDPELKIVIYQNISRNLKRFKLTIYLARINLTEVGGICRKHCPWRIFYHMEKFKMWFFVAICTLSHEIISQLFVSGDKLQISCLKTSHCGNKKILDLTFLFVQIFSKRLKLWFVKIFPKEWKGFSLISNRSRSWQDLPTLELKFLNDKMFVKVKNLPEAPKRGVLFSSSSIRSSRWFSLNSVHIYSYPKFAKPFR